MYGIGNGSCIMYGVVVSRLLEALLFLTLVIKLAALKGNCQFEPTVNANRMLASVILALYRCAGSATTASYPRYR